MYGYKIKLPSIIPQPKWAAKVTVDDYNWQNTAQSDCLEFAIVTADTYTVCFSDQPPEEHRGSNFHCVVGNIPVNGDNLLNGTIAPSWHDEASDLAGEVSQPFPGYWEGVALSNHCSRDCEANGSPRVCRSRLAIHRGIPRLGYHVAIFGSLISGIELTIEVHSVNFRLQFDSQVAGGEILGHIVDAVGKRHTVNQLVHDLLDHRSRNISHKGKSKHEKHTGIAL